MGFAGRLRTLKEETRSLHNHQTDQSQSEAERGAMFQTSPKQPSDAYIHPISILIELIFGPSRRHAT